MIKPSEGEYNTEYIMPTTVHIPRFLLAAVDRHARSLRISRNRLIVDALERQLAAASEWSPRLLDELRAADADTVEAVDDLIATVTAARRSKVPPRL